MLVTFLIPVKNEVKTVKIAIEEVLNLNYPQKEIIIIDNNSDDGSKEVINTYQNFENVKIILKDKNLGYGDTIKKGVEIARGDLIYIQYADLEYDIKGFNLMLEKQQKTNADFVFGERYESKNFANNFKEIINRPSYFATLITSGMINLFYSKNFNDIIGGKLYKSDKIRLININANYQGFDFELVSRIMKNKYHVEKVFIPYKPRKNSSEKKIKFYHMFNAIYEILRIKFFC